MKNATMSNSKLIFKNTILLYIRAIMILVISLYTSRVLLHALGVDDFGLYNVVAGFVSMFGFLNTIMVNSIQRFLNIALGKKNEDEYESVFCNALIAQIILAVIILLLTETIGFWFISNQLNIPPDRRNAAEFVYHFVIISFVIKVLQTPFTAIVISKERMSFYSIQGVVEVVLLLAVAFAVDHTNFDGLKLYAVLLTIIALVVFGMNVIFARISYPQLRIRRTENIGLLKKIMNFAGWNLFGSISSLFKSQGINILLNIFFTTSVNAARGLAFQVLGGVSSMVGNFQTALNPQLIQSYAENNHRKYENLVCIGSKISFFLMWYMVLPLVMSINQVLAIWLGSEYIPEYTAIFTKIILFTGLVDSLASIVSTGVYAVGKMKVYQVVVSIIILSIIPISYILLRLGYAPESTMYVSLFVSIVAQCVRVIIWTKLSHCSIKNYLLNVVVHLIAVAVLSYGIVKMCVVHTFRFDNNWLYVLSVVLLTVIVNTACMYVFGINQKERNYINVYICNILVRYRVLNKK